MHRFAYPVAMLASLVVFVLVRSWQKDSQVLQSIPRRARIGIALAAFCGSMLGSKLPDAVGIVDGKPSGLFADGKSVTTGLLGGYLRSKSSNFGLGLRSKPATASPCLLLPPWPSDDSAASFMDAATASQQHFRGEWILAMEFSVIRLSCMRVCFIWPVRWHSSLRDVCLN